MTYLEEVIRENFPNYKEMIIELIEDHIKKEEPTTRVSYNGFNGELVKLEKKSNTHIDLCSVPAITSPAKYDLSIYDHEKKVTHSFTDVNLKDVKFMCGSVSFE